MEPKKIFGWGFLILGILIIFYIIFNSYQIFTKKALPPDLFKIKGEEKPLPVSLKPLTPEEKAEAIAREEFQKQFQKMLPPETITHF